MHRSQSHTYKRLRQTLRPTGGHKDGPTHGAAPTKTDIRALNLHQLQRYQAGFARLPIAGLDPAQSGKRPSVPGKSISAPPKVAVWDEGSIFQAEALALREVDLSKHHPSTPLLRRLPFRFWLRYQAIPWVQLGDTIAVAFGDASQIDEARPELQAAFGPFIPVLAPKEQIMQLLVSHMSPAMARKASLPAKQQNISGLLLQEIDHRWTLYAVGTLLSLVILLPREVFSLFCGLALILLLLFAGLKLSGLVAHFSYRRRRALSLNPLPEKADLPMISVLAPLYREAAISSALLQRIQQLDYPRDRLEVLLVLEEEDDLTRGAVQELQLPFWIRVIEVPAWGPLRTKPRAMNYALDFCRGDIIGVWDAEDAPQPDQLRQVAAAFAAAPQKVACFQGFLDYYNPGANWIARCFTLEYASWFRIVLPGIARLGLVVPLGGTTMFIRRKVLDEMAGWDSHNVTEDADLGVRLYRAGFQTCILPTTTHEEAACHFPSWIRQRSRWLKGFMVTYLVHMRHPLRLLHDLGWRGFLGFQAFFLGSVGQFLLAPFIWSFWLYLLGAPHPSSALIPEMLIWVTVSSLLFFELLGISIAALAAVHSGRPGLAIWSVTLPVYFLMGPVAVYKALYELLFDPYYWDKTSHGVHPPDGQTHSDAIAERTSTKATKGGSS